MALILIADDDELVIDVVRGALGARRHIVGAVDDGTPVAAIVETKRPALVILDCNMPECSGIDALLEIRRSPSCYATPVMMLTASRGKIDEDIALRAGANDYMRKPFDADQLVVRVEALLSRAEARKPKLPVQPVRSMCGSSPAVSAWRAR